MIFAVLAILSFAIQNLCCKEYGRRFPESISNQSAMVTVATLIVLLIMAVAGGARPLLPGEWGIALAFGFFFVVTLVSMTLAMNYGHMGITLLIQNSSLIVPTLYGVAVWHERFTAPKAIGAILILAMLALSALDDSAAADEATQRRWNRKLWVLFTALSFTGDSVLGILQGSMANSATDSVTFTFWTSLFSMVFAAALFVTMRRRQPGTAELVRQRPGAFAACCAGIGLGTAGGNCFSIMALTVLPGIVLFPLRQGGLVLLMWVIGAVLYREKVKRTGWLMLALGLAGLVLLNL